MVILASFPDVRMFVDHHVYINKFLKLFYSDHFTRYSTRSLICGTMLPLLFTINQDKAGKADFLTYVGTSLKLCNNFSDMDLKRSLDKFN